MTGSRLEIRRETCKFDPVGSTAPWSQRVGSVRIGCCGSPACAGSIVCSDRNICNSRFACCLGTIRIIVTENRSRNGPKKPRCRRHQSDQNHQPIVVDSYFFFHFILLAICNNQPLCLAVLCPIPTIGYNTRMPF